MISTRNGAMQAFLNLRESTRKSGVQDMTEEEINEEIRHARMEGK